jgi:hypothetical protein
MKLLGSNLKNKDGKDVTKCLPIKVVYALDFEASFKVLKTEMFFLKKS